MPINDSTATLVHNRATTGVRAFMRTPLLLFVGATLAWPLSSEGAAYAGWAVGNAWDGYGTILRSTDSGASWSRQGVGQLAGVKMESVVAVNPNTAWVVGDMAGGYATIYHTTDGGLTWDRKGSAAQVPNTSLFKVTAFGDNNIWAVGPGTILHSADGGATWANQIPVGYEGVHLQGVHTPDGINVWATGSPLNGDHATILKSGDGGLNWTRQKGGDVPLLDHILGVSAVNADTAWVMGGTVGAQEWMVQKTSNGGLTWTQQNSGQNDGNNIYAVDLSTIWAVSDYTIQWTVDGGANWSGSSSQYYTMGISAVDSLQAWAVSNEQYGTIFHTIDGGTSWAKLTHLGGEALPGLENVSFSTEAIPEPSSAVLLAIGLAAMTGRSRRHW